MEVIISDRVSAYGIFIRALLDRKKVMYIKSHNIENFKEHPSSKFLIYVISETSHISFLNKLLDNHFDKVIVCYDILNAPYVSIKKPHAFISLNKRRKTWSQEILMAMLKLKGNEALELLNKGNNTVKNFITTHINSKQYEK